MTLQIPLLATQKTEIYMNGFLGQQVLGLKTLPVFSGGIWGFDRGRMIIVGARTSQGKTAFMTQLSHDFAAQGYKSVFLSLEQTLEEICMRDFCREKRIDGQEIKRGGFLKYKKQWEEYVKYRSGLNLTISDCLGKSWRDINTIIEQSPLSKPDVIFIDHINDIRVEGNNARFEIDDYLLNIRVLAKQHKITFIIGAQINRANQDDKDKMPQLHHLKGTGKLEEVADMALLLHWPHFYDTKKNRNDYMLVMAKNRFGQTGYHQIYFYPEHSLFSEVNLNVQEVPNAKPTVRKQIREEDILWDA